MSAFGLYLKNTVLLSPAPVHGIVWCVSASVCTHSDMHTTDLGQDFDSFIIVSECRGGVRR